MIFMAFEWQSLISFFFTLSSLKDWHPWKKELVLTATLLSRAPASIHILQYIVHVPLFWLGTDVLSSCGLPLLNLLHSNHGRLCVQLSNKTIFLFFISYCRCTSFCSSFVIFLLQEGGEHWIYHHILDPNTAHV